MTVKTFISRPLLSLVISVFIVLLGVISLLSLPVERYPDIAPPAIYVWASYPGASAETVHKSVVMPLEEAMNGLSVTLFTTTLVFMVIFIPVAFVGGITREESQTSGRVIFRWRLCCRCPSDWRAVCCSPSCSAWRTTSTCRSGW